MTESFSGAHPFRPACLGAEIRRELLTAMTEAEINEEMVVDHVATLVELIDAGRCPRCGGALPDPPIRPAGSRVTACRCVPVCGRCGDHEGLGIGAVVARWPIDRTEDDAFYEQKMAGFMAEEVTVTPDTAEGMLLRGREHPGGWAEHGYDDSADEEERKR